MIWDLLLIYFDNVGSKWVESCFKKIGNTTLKNVCDFTACNGLVFKRKISGRTFTFGECQTSLEKKIDSEFLENIIDQMIISLKNKELAKSLNLAKN